MNTHLLASSYRTLSHIPGQKSKSIFRSLNIFSIIYIQLDCVQIFLIPYPLNTWSEVLICSQLECAQMFLISHPLIYLVRSLNLYPVGMFPNVSHIVPSHIPDQNSKSIFSCNVPRCSPYRSHSSITSGNAGDEFDYYDDYDDYDDICKLWFLRLLNFYRIALSIRFALISYLLHCISVLVDLLVKAHRSFISPWWKLISRNGGRGKVSLNEIRGISAHIHYSYWVLSLFDMKDWEWNSGTLWMYLFIICYNIVWQISY